MTPPPPPGVCQFSTKTANCVVIFQIRAGFHSRFSNCLMKLFDTSPQCRWSGQCDDGKIKFWGINGRRKQRGNGEKLLFCVAVLRVLPHQLSFNFLKIRKFLKVFLNRKTKVCLSSQHFVRDSNSSECTEFFVQIQLFYPHKFSNYHCFSPKRTHENPLTVSSRVHKLLSITARSVFPKDPAGPLWKFPPLLNSVGNVLPRRSPAQQPHPNSQLWPRKRRGGVFLPKSRSCNCGV